MTRRMPFLALATLTLAACTAVGPDYRAPEPDLPAVWRTPVATAPAADPARWWAQLGDAQLDRLITRALAANRDLEATRARLRESRARGTRAEAGHSPTLAAATGAQHGQRGDAAAQTAYNAGFDASWEADVFGGIRRDVEAARADVAVAEATLADAQVSLVAEVALNVVSLRNTQARLELARANLASQRETLQLVTWREQAGLASAVEREQARANAAQTEAQLPALETALAQTQYRLEVLLGEAPGALAIELAAPRALPTLPARIALAIPADTLRNRPDLRAAERQLAAETARVGSAQADRYPSLRLTGSLGAEALAFSALGASSTLVRSLAANLAVTIFDGGRLRAQVAIQEAVRDRALATYQASVLAALADVENALVDYVNSDTRRAALATAVDAARTAAGLARQRYTSGLIDFQTVLETGRSQRSAEDNLATAEAERVSAFIRLYKALGGGWQTNIQEQPVP